jgi:hypothetical protein
MKTRLQQIFSIPWLADLSAVAGILAYTWQLWSFAHSQRSVLDEGLYLYKGLQYVLGRYQPFEPYSFWTNQMPLSFYIPGWVQVIFGPGLRTGRYFAVLLAALMLVAVWLTARRIGSPWIGAGAAWAFVLMPATARIYSQAVSQGLVACLLGWIMALALGERRRMWQLVLAGLLSGVMVMARINMLPVLVLLALYIWWERDFKSALWVGLAGLAVVVVGHAAFWPGILSIWGSLGQRFGIAALKPWFPPEGVTPFWQQDVAFSDRFNSFFETVRYHFIPIAGLLVVAFLWPHRRDWKSTSHFKMTVFLAALFVMMILMHTWAAVGNDYCVLCLRVYTGFYESLGILLLAASLRSWRRELPRWAQMLAVSLVFATLLGIGYSGAQDINAAFPVEFFRYLMNIGVPIHRASGWDTVELWRIAANFLHLDFEQSFDLFKLLVPLALTGLAGGLILLFSGMQARRYRGASLPRSFGVWTLILFIVTGSLLSPTRVLSDGYQVYDCGGDEIAVFEQVGVYLRETLPPGAKIYWKGYTPVNLLYVPEVEIYPPQLNLAYTYKTTGETEALYRYGWWNEELSRRWIAEADYALIEVRYYDREQWLKDVLESGDFEELMPTISTAPCTDDAIIRIFKRK